MLVFSSDVMILNLNASHLNSGFLTQSHFTERCVPAPSVHGERQNQTHHPTVHAKQHSWMIKKG